MAIVLSVSLGLSSLSYAAVQNTGNEGTNSGMLSYSDTSNQLDPSAQALLDCVTQVFHYESGILTAITAADGTISVYDQGRFRGTMAMGADGEYTWSNFVLYGSDFDMLMKEYDGDLDAFGAAIGVKPEQFEGGGEEAVEFLVADLDTKKEAELKKQGYKIDKKKGEYYTYKTKENDEEVTKCITKAEFDALSDTEKKKCEKTASAIKVSRDRQPSQHVKWMGSTLQHLAKGINYSVSIDFSASQGAAVTFNIDGKARQTFAWDGALTTSYDYTISGTITYQLKKGVDLAESLKTGKAQTEDKWQATETVGGVVIGVYEATLKNGSFSITGTTSTMEYKYNKDGTIQSVTNLETNETTHYVANKVTSVTGPLKDSKGNTKTNSNGDPVIGVTTTYTYYNNGLINTTTSHGADGSVETTVYLNNKALGTYAGNAAEADAFRSNFITAYQAVFRGTNTTSFQWDSRVKSINWPPEILAKIYYKEYNADTGKKEFKWDNNRLNIYMTIMGWNTNDGEITKKAKGLIETALGNTNWLSPALSMTLSDTAYSDNDLANSGSTTKVKNSKGAVKKLPSNKFASSAVVFNHGVQYAAYNFSNYDPSVAIAFTQFMGDTFNVNDPQFVSMVNSIIATLNKKGDEKSKALAEKLKAVYITKTKKAEDTFNTSDFETIMDEVSSYIEKKVDEIIKNNVGKDGKKLKQTGSDKKGYTYTCPALDSLLSMFKDKRIGDSFITKVNVTAENKKSTSAASRSTNTLRNGHANTTSFSTSYKAKTKTDRTDITKKQKDARKALADGIKKLKNEIKSFFETAKGNITSGNLADLKSAMSNKLTNGCNKTFEAKKITTTTYNPTIKMTVDDPGFLGDLDSVEYDPETGKYYAVLKNVKMDVGYGLESTDREKVYVEISEDEYNDLKQELENAKEEGVAVVYSGAGYFGPDRDGCYCIVDVYDSFIDYDRQEAENNFQENMADNEEYQQNMEENRKKLEKDLQDVTKLLQQFGISVKNLQHFSVDDRIAVVRDAWNHGMRRYRANF